MHSATTTLSSRGRIRTVALAATIALGTLFPSLAAVQAQDSGFDVSVTSTDQLTGLTAVVSGSDNGLRLRSEPAHDAEVIDTLLDGTQVTLRIDRLDTVRDPDGTTRWWPVSVNGQEGWVSGFYLSNDETAAASDGTESATPDVTSATPDVTVGDETSEAEAPTGESFSFEGDSLVGATARVAGGGGSVNLRAEPTANAELVTTLTDGAVVNLRIDVMDTVVADDIRWWPVTIDGHEGWVAGQFLTADDGSTTAPATDTATESSGRVFAAGDYVSTFTGDGDGVNLRAEASPDGALLETLSEGTVIQVMEGPVSFTNSEAGWFKVTNGTVTGFVDGDLLQAASQPSSSTDTATSTAFVAGDFALVQTQTQAGARIRSGSSPESERIGFVPETDVVEILSGPASFESSDRGWFEVSYNGTTGYIDGDLLVKTEAPAPDPAPVTPVADPAPSTSTTTPTGPFGSGETVVTNSQTGVGVNVRVAPGTASERVGYLADQSSLQVVEGPSQDTELADWYKVSDGSIEGWVAGEFLERPGSQADGVPEETARFIAPLEDYILTQHFGCSNLGYYSYNADFGCNVHDGTDLATTAGSDVLASADGTVVFSGWCDCGLGYYVEIDHGDGFHTVYGHMRSQPPVEVGQQVSQGDVIGPVGSTGLSTGPHVHFMIRLNGTAVDPRDYVNFDD